MAIIPRNHDDEVILKELAERFQLNVAGAHSVRIDVEPPRAANARGYEFTVTATMTLSEDEGQAVLALAIQD